MKIDKAEIISNGNMNLKNLVVQEIRELTGVKTNYTNAWLKYCNSNEYSRSLKELLSKGIREPFATNILRSAFDAGFNSHH